MKMCLIPLESLDQELKLQNLLEWKITIRGYMSTHSRKGHIPKLSPIVSTSGRLGIVFFTQNINLRSDASSLSLIAKFVSLFLSLNEDQLNWYVCDTLNTFNGLQFINTTPYSFFAFIENHSRFITIQKGLLTMEVGSLPLKKMQCKKASSQWSIVALLLDSRSSPNQRLVPR